MLGLQIYKQIGSITVTSKNNLNKVAVLLIVNTYLALLIVTQTQLLNVCGH